MKIVKALVRVPLLSLLLICGCATDGPGKQANRRFREASSADVVLQFSSWNYTFMIKPRYDDHGFLNQVPRDKVGQILDQLGTRKRELAVIVVGWNRGPEELARLAEQWKLILSGCGFHRLVVLRSNGSKELNGAFIVDDSNLLDSQTKTAAQF